MTKLSFTWRVFVFAPHASLHALVYAPAQLTASVKLQAPCFKSQLSLRVVACSSLAMRSTLSEILVGFVDGDEDVQRRRPSTRKGARSVRFTLWLGICRDLECRVDHATRALNFRDFGETRNQQIVSRRTFLLFMRQHNTQHGGSKH